MRRWLSVAASVSGTALVATMTLGRVTLHRWKSESERLMRELAAPFGPNPDRTELVSFADLVNLPAPVQRYFRCVLQDGQRAICAVRIEQTGHFNMRAAGSDWQRFEATQFYRVQPAGYVWDARIRLAPLVDVRVRDTYISQHGSMHGIVLGMIDIMNERDRHELDEGALQRYLAEAVFFPTALLPQAGVTWTAIDDTHAGASLTDGATTARLDFEFSASGEIVSVSTKRRYRIDKGRYVAAPWGGRYSRYETHEGMRVPTEANVYWIVAGRESSYIAMHVVQASYEFTADARPHALA